MEHAFIRRVFRVSLVRGTQDAVGDGATCMSAQLAFVKQGETLGVSKAEISARREIGDSKSYAGLYIEVEFY